MKKEKRPLPTRRKKALRRICIMAAVLFIVNGVQHIGLLLPRQAVCELEQRSGTGHTAVVQWLWAPQIHRTHLLCLSENENAVLLSDLYLSVYGWMPGFGWELDCGKPAPLYAGVRSIQEAQYYFGRVNDPAITAVEITAYAEDYDEESHAVQGEQIWDLRTETLLEKQGRRYFLLQTDSSPAPEAAYKITVTGLDAQGNPCAQVTDIPHMFTHYG